MLDLTKIAGQMPGLSAHFNQEREAGQKRLHQAQALFAQVRQQQTPLVALQETWSDRLLFNAAMPVEPIDLAVDLPSPPESHTVFATDGSQIAPSHHEIAYCYLINTGRVMLHYGQSLHPLLDSLPEIYYRAEDLRLPRQWGIRTEEWIGYLRTVSESQILSDLACHWVLPPGAHDTTPNLALLDGSLIYWFLENLPPEAKERILFPILSAWENLHTTGIPYLSYISNSRSVSATNFLRLGSCTFDQPHCFANCGHLVGDRLPCDRISPLRDTTLWQTHLAPGQRSGLWKSMTRISQQYDPPLQVYFCYVHVGTEIARVEMPAWVAEDSALLAQSLGILLGQVHKGYGYPVALAESHNQAVVRGSDRRRFFAFLEQELIKTGVRNVGVSYKESLKRNSIA